MVFSYQKRWAAVTVCAICSFVAVTFRDTIGNIRIRALYRARESHQYALDQKAEKYLNTLRSGQLSKSRPLILFLRPFSGDRELHAKDPNSPDGYDVMPLESRLAKAFSNQFTTIAFKSRFGDGDVWGDKFVDMLDITVNHPDFYKYAGKLFYNRPGEITATDENWFDTFRLLAQNADLIISIPLDASQAEEPSSTILELLDLRTYNMVERCVFVMPPEQSPFMLRPADKEETHHKTDHIWMKRELKLGLIWESTRAKLAKNGFALPELRDTVGGATVFTLRGEESVILPVTLPELSNHNLYF
jgi:hypothetical protein